MKEVKLVEISKLKPALYNPREVLQERLDLVRFSLRKLGFLLPIMATPEGEILSGHQRYAVAVDMGAKKVPVMFVPVKEKHKRGLNILFNRATNDMHLHDVPSEISDKLTLENVLKIASEWEDIDPNSKEFAPCLELQDINVKEFANKNIQHFVRHAANVGRMLARLHVAMPIVATKDGNVINGIGRLEAFARKGKEFISVVFIDNQKAEIARSLLNLLSMEFSFTGDNADFLRYGAYRRAFLKRTHLGTGFVFPVFKSKRRSDLDLSNPKHLGLWQDKCGKYVLDFGAGHGDEANILRKAGIEVTTFEPYPADKNIVNREKARASAMGFLNEIRKGKDFDSIFLSSVLNSVPFSEDREHILRICASLASTETTVYLAARSRYDSYWRSVERGEVVSEKGARTCHFPLSLENGVVLGDLANNPKVQKLFSREEFQELLEKFFGEVTVSTSSAMVTGICKKPLHIPPQDLIKSLKFEFDLPYPDGKRMGLANLALKAFSMRLGYDLEEML